MSLVESSGEGEWHELELGIGLEVSEGPTEENRPDVDLLVSEFLGVCLQHVDDVLLNIAAAGCAE